MSVDLDEIERLAKAATPGPWTGSIETDPETDKPGIVWADVGHHCIGDMYATDDADYVAAANPAVVLELIAELRKAKDIVRDLAGSNPVRALPHGVGDNGEECMLCLSGMSGTQAFGDHMEAHHHVPRCPYRRAVEFKP